MNMQSLNALAVCLVLPSVTADSRSCPWNCPGGKEEIFFYFSLNILDTTRRYVRSVMESNLATSFIDYYLNETTLNSTDHVLRSKITHVEARSVKTALAYLSSFGYLQSEEMHEGQEATGQWDVNEFDVKALEYLSQSQETINAIKDMLANTNYRKVGEIIEADRALRVRFSRLNDSMIATMSYLTFSEEDFKKRIFERTTLRAGLLERIKAAIESSMAANRKAKDELANVESILSSLTALSYKKRITDLPEALDKMENASAERMLELAGLASKVTEFNNDGNSLSDASSFHDKVYADVGDTLSDLTAVWDDITAAIKYCTVLAPLLSSSVHQLDSQIKEVVTKFKQ